MHLKFIKILGTTTMIIMGEGQTFLNELIEFEGVSYVHNLK